MTDTPMHTEQPGSRQVGNLLEAMAESGFDAYHDGNAGWENANDMERYRWRGAVAGFLGVLIHRGLVSAQCLELLKEQE